MAVAEDPQQQLDWEARQRPRAAVAAVLAAVLVLGADLYSGAQFRDAPRSDFLGALQRGAEPGAVGTQPSGRTEFFEYYEQHATELLAGSVARAIGLVALGWALTFLAAAARSRRPEMPRLALPLALVGAGLSAVSTMMGVVGSTEAVSDFLDGPRTVDAAREVTSGSLLITAQFIDIAGRFALAAAFVLVSLNAMRAGLLTRFLGILGVIVGVLIIIPIGPVQVVQPFWLLAAGVLFAGAWPGGVPPAWRTGRAEPWPTTQQIAEERRRLNAERRGKPPPEPPDASAGNGEPPDVRRKRKRRR